MDKKEYLTEENYEKGKNTLRKIIKIILTVGISLSLLLILSGIVIILTSNNKGENEITSSKVSSEEVIKADIVVIEAKINELKKDLPSLKAQESTEIRANGRSQKYYELEQQISDIEEEIRDLASEKKSLERKLEAKESGLNDDPIFNFLFGRFSEIGPKGFLKQGLGAVLIFIGFGILPPTFMISGFIFLISKRREIATFATQQTMPIAKEGVEKMAPTIGKAAGTISKDIAKGIKEGISEADNNQNK